MLRRIQLYGSLAKYIGQRVLHADVASAAEAVRYLVANWPGVRQHMADRHYKVAVGNDCIDPTGPDLHMEAGAETIKFIPVVAGAIKLGEIFKIVVGVALVVAAFAIPGSTVILGVEFSKLSLAVGLTGAGLIAEGTAGLLAPTFSDVLGPDGNKDPRKSYSFSNIQNVSRQGVAIPVVYGETIVGSVVVSAGIDVSKKIKK